MAESADAHAVPDIAALHQVILSTESLDEFLDGVLTCLAGRGDGDEALSCGLTVPSSGSGGAYTFRSSDALAGGLDEFQYGAGDGPCLQALSTGETVSSDDLHHEARWTGFVAAAQQAGARSVLSVPLHTDQTVVGAVNVYHPQPGGISQALRERVTGFALDAAGAVAVAARLANDQHRTDELADTRTREIADLHQQATHDELTGLYNRRGIHELLDTLLENGLREHVAVFYCDLDRFKRINDGLGHDAGDDVLTAVAQRFNSGLPASCTPARLAGDEFLVVCADVTSLGGLDQVTTRIAELLRSTIPVHDTVVQISTSVGAAMVTGPGINSADLLRFADAAMFEAKSTGPGTVAHASQALMTTVNRQLHLEADLRSALSNHSLQLHYQPIVDNTGSIIMAEALLRWQHPEHGQISPKTILDVATGGTLLAELDRYVLHTALTEAASWPPAPTGHPRAVAVNLSGLLPDRDGFTDEITHALDQAGLPAHQAVLEITETPLAGLLPHTQQTMRTLTDRGVRFAIDDFGTGYSSLARLKDLPTQILKLDQHFTAGMSTSTSDYTLTEAMLTMARATGHITIAEGVETSAQYHQLHDLGCHAYQGWLFAPPVPAHQLKTVLTDRVDGAIPN